MARKSIRSLWSQHLKLKEFTTVSSSNLQGRGREGTQRAILPETTSAGQGGGRFGSGAGQVGVPRTATL